MSLLSSQWAQGRQAFSSERHTHRAPLALTWDLHRRASPMRTLPADLHHLNLGGLSMPRGSRQLQPLPRHSRTSEPAVVLCRPPCRSFLAGGGVNNARRNSPSFHPQSRMRSRINASLPLSVSETELRLFLHRGVKCQTVHQTRIFSPLPTIIRSMII